MKIHWDEIEAAEQAEIGKQMSNDFRMGIE